MLIEQRIYTIRPGQMAVFLQGVERLALPVQQEILGGLMGYFIAETGELNQAVHFWAYQDLEDRRQRREALKADPRWSEVSKALADLVVRMESRLLYPAKFSPTAWLTAALGQGESGRP